MATYNEYEDKEALIENPSIPDINKVKANDMNYLKYAVPKIKNEVDSSYTTNLIKSKNLCSGYNQSLYINSGVNQATIVSGNTGLYIPVSGGNYTISTTDTQTIYRVGLTSNVPSANSQTLYSGTNKDNTSDSITIDTTGYSYLCITCTDLSKIQIEKGSTETTYEEFVPKSIVVEDEKFTDTLNVGSVVDSSNRVNFLKSNNLFNKDIILSGYYIDASGNLVQDSGNFVGDYIKLNQTNYFVSVGTESQPIRVAYYNSSKTFISRELIYGSGALTIPNNTYYVRLSTYNTDLDSLMLNEGSEALSYEPYITPSIVVDGETIYQEPVLLWQNSSPSSEFANQTVNLNENANKYKFIEIYYKARNDINEWVYTKFPVGTYGWCNGLSAAGTSFRAYNRQANNETDTSKLSFGSCNFVNTLSSERTTNNAYLIPVYVYGIK